MAAWFPLGPREVYQPWYPTSAVYINRVNVTNIYSRNTVEVRSIYNNRSTNVYENRGGEPASTASLPSQRCRSAASRVDARCVSRCYTWTRISLTALP